MAKRKQSTEERTIPLPLSAGMYSSGDGGMLPGAYARKLRNMLRVDGVWYKRAPFVFDGLTAVHGLGAWEDREDATTRLVAIDDSGALRVQDLGADTFTLASGTVTGTRLTSFVTYRGVGYGALDDGNGTPQSVFSFNGTTVDSSPIASAIKGRIVLFYKERLFIFHPLATITNLINWQAAYTASGGNWNLSDVDAREVISGSTTLGEIIPTAPTGAYAYKNVEQIIALTEPSRRVWLCDLHNTSASYQMPLKLQMVIANAWGTVTAYAAGEIVTPSATNGYRYRAVVDGTSDVAEPAWPTTIGDTIIDGTVTWLCDATNVLDGGERQVVVPSSSLEPGFTRYVVEANLPPTPGEYTLRAYIVFGNSSSATVTPVALHMGLRDGRSDDDPDKRNFGQQVTEGDYFFPFFNAESDIPITQDLDEIIWSEVGEPARIRAISSYRLGGQAGYTQAAVVFDGRIYVFKRRSYLKFSAVEDANIVVLPEGDETLGIGCLCPQALDIHAGVMYWADENTVYALKAGTGEIPRDICGDRMRAEIMNKDPNSWVESQATHNAPIVRAHPRLHLVFVHMQKGKIHVYHIKDDAWSVLDAQGDLSVDPVGSEVRAIAYNHATGNMHIAFGTAATGTAGLARLDDRTGVAAQRDQISTAGASDVVAEVWPRAIETTGPHSDASVDLMRMRHKITGDQSGQFFGAQVSFDGGVTFGPTIVMDVTASTGAFEPIEFPIYQSWNTIQLRIGHGGNGGATEFSISELEVDISIMPFYAKKTPSYLGNTL